MPVLQAAAALLLVFLVFGVNIHSSIFTSYNFLIYKDNRIYRVSVFCSKIGFINMVIYGNKHI